MFGTTLHIEDWTTGRNETVFQHSCNCVRLKCIYCVQIFISCREKDSASIRVSCIMWHSVGIRLRSKCKNAARERGVRKMWKWNKWCVCGMSCSRYAVRTHTHDSHTRKWAAACAFNNSFAYRLNSSTVQLIKITAVQSRKSNVSHSKFEWEEDEAAKPRDNPMHH